MYVTDRPVMDRITDTPRWETRVALDALDAALIDLENGADEAISLIEDVERDEPLSSSPDETRMGLSDALSAVLSASESVTEALGRLGIEAL